MRVPRLVCLLAVFVGSTTVHSSAFAGPCSGIPQCCEVTNSAGVDAPGTLLRHLGNQVGMGFSECATITFAVSSVDPLAAAPILLSGNKLIGDGKISINLGSGAVNSGCVIDVQSGAKTKTGSGSSTIDKVNVQAGTIDGVCVHSTGNTISNVKVTGAGSQNVASECVKVTTGGATLSNITASKCGVGVSLEGSPSVIAGGNFSSNGVGIELSSDKNTIGGASIYSNDDDGVQVFGSGNVIGKSSGAYSQVNILNNGGAGVLVSGAAALKNLITHNSFANDAGKGIELASGGNASWPAPSPVRLVFYNTSNPAKMLLIGWVKTGTSAVEYYLADSAASGEGKTFKGDITAAGAFFLDWTDTGSSSGDGKQIVAQVITGSLLPTTTPFVTLAISSDANTSEFSPATTPATVRVDGDPDACIKATWFLKSFDTNPAGDPWTVDWDKDGWTNGQEDKDHDCVKDAGESNPDDPKDPPKPGPDPCVTNPDSCKDTDKDGVTDDKDNCDLIPNPDQKDSDGDGIGDVCEDADGDGTPNSTDNCPWVKNSDQKDLDGDSAGDACDPDDDNDGILDVEETAAGTKPDVPDTDGDQICDGPGWGYGSGSTLCARPADNCPLAKNTSSLDQDEDGIGDPCDAVVEGAFGGGDSDGDNVVDSADNCPAIDNPSQLDTDGDSAGDPCDSDDDNDGLDDWVESGMQKGVGNGNGVALGPKDPDSDGDGYCDGAGPGFGGACSPRDNCPGASNTDPATGLQPDGDSDGVGTACEDTTAKGDADRDGVSDAKDNCPVIPNTDQRNTDGDTYAYNTTSLQHAGGGDACDQDDDNDGLMDWVESFVPRLHQWEPDSDHYSGQGFDDYCDGPAKGYGSLAATVCKSSDNCPVRYNPGQEDTNSNGIGDVCDQEGFGDMDKDGVPDGSDNCPTVANPDQADSDNDGAGDECDADDDNDGIMDGLDNCPFTPNADQFDTDGDGAGDACDVFDIVTEPGGGTFEQFNIEGGGPDGPGSTNGGRCTLIPSGVTEHNFMHLLTEIISLLVLPIMLVGSRLRVSRDGVFRCPSSGSASS